jgi:hypothetical protein
MKVEMAEDAGNILQCPECGQETCRYKSLLFFILFKNTITVFILIIGHVVMRATYHCDVMKLKIRIKRIHALLWRKP